MPSRRIIPKILVAGRTGAGKSSLLNAILGKTAFETGVRPTTMGFDVQVWKSPWGEVEVIDSRGFAEADTAAAVAGGGSIIQKGYEDAHFCLLVVAAGRRDFEPEAKWIAEGEKAGLFNAVPTFVILSRIDTVPPTRDWNPDLLNLQSPATEKENNIRGQYDYLTSLPSFKRFADLNRIIPVSAGEIDPNNPGFDRPTYGIKELQDRIFQALPDAIKTEYARMARRIELTKIAISKMVWLFALAQISFGALVLTVVMMFQIFGTAEEMKGFFQLLKHLPSFLSAHLGTAHPQSDGTDYKTSFRDAYILDYIGLLVSFVVPIFLQLLMVYLIGRKHGLKGVFGKILSASFHPKKSRDKTALAFANTLGTFVTVGFSLCCCCPLGLFPIASGLFLTRPVTNYFNEAFFQVRLLENEVELQKELKATKETSKPPPLPGAKPPPLPR